MNRSNCPFAGPETAVMRRGSTQRGFTLIEVMIALAILSAGLAVMLRSTAGDVYTTQRVHMRSVSTELARGKMYDLEEELKIQGFQETDQEEDGDFSDQGWPQIKWKAEIVKIELPDMSALQQMQGQGQGGADGEAGDSAGAGGMMGGGMMGGGTDQSGASGQSSMGGMIMGAYYQMISKTLEASIRKVTLTVTYPLASGSEDIVVGCYFTDPAAVNREIPLASGPGGTSSGDEGDDSGDTGTGTGTGTGVGGGARPSNPRSGSGTGTTKGKGSLGGGR